MPSCCAASWPRTVAGDWLDAPLRNNRMPAGVVRFRFVPRSSSASDHTRSTRFAVARVDFDMEWPQWTDLGTPRSSALAGGRTVQPRECGFFNGSIAEVALYAR